MIAAALASGRAVLADGGLGTALFAAGLPRDAAPEAWTEARPEAVRAVHRAAVAAGARVILTNSFGANPVRLARWGAAPRLEALNRAAAGLARAEAGPGVTVAGAIGPLGAPADREAAAAAFEAQGRALLAGGADLLWLETFGALAEFAAAVAALARIGAPWCATMSFAADGRSWGGATPADFAAEAGRTAVPPLALGANCGAGPQTVLAALDGLRAAGVTLPLIAKANAGLPRAGEGGLAYDVTPAEMARYAVAARARGAGIVGGCCGVGPAHLAAMAAALKEETA